MTHTEQLLSLPRLPWTTYHWPQAIVSERIANPAQQRFLEALVRVTGTYCLYGDGLTDPILMRQAVETCAVTGGSIGLIFSPWHKIYPAAIPDPARPEYEQELTFFRKRCEAMMANLDAANAACGTHVCISQAYLDSEQVWRWRKNPDQAREALDAIARLAVEYLPGVPVVWHSRGMESDARTGTMQLAQWTGTEIAQVLSCTLYDLGDLDRMKATYIATEACAIASGIPLISVAISLGSGFKRESLADVWRYNYDYPVDNSREMGRWLRTQKRVHSLFLYPQPCHQGAPGFGEHLAAFCEGAR